MSCIWENDWEADVASLAVSVDQQDKIVYSDYMAELGLEPNYGEVINAAKSALS